MKRIDGRTEKKWFFSAHFVNGHPAEEYKSASLLLHLPPKKKNEQWRTQSSIQPAPSYSSESRRFKGGSILPELSLSLPQKDLRWHKDGPIRPPDEDG